MLPLLPLISAGLNAAGGLISGNQARQDKKGALGKAAKATDFAKTAYEADRAARDPYKNMALDKLTAAGTTPDFSSDYASTPTYTAVDPVRTGAKYVNGQLVDTNVPTYTPLDTPDVTYRPVSSGIDDTVTKSLAAVTDAPDRLTMAKQALDDWEQQNAPAFLDERRQIAGNAAALGRIGNQGEATSLGRAVGRQETARGTARNAALRDALDSMQADKMAALVGSRGVASDLYGRAATERNVANDIAGTTRANAAGERSYRDVLKSAAGTQDKYLTEQQKGERSYKDTLSQRAVENAAARREAERVAGLTEFGKGTSLASIGLNGMSPSGVINTLGNEANIYSGNATQASQDAGNFFANTGASLADLLKARAKVPSPTKIGSTYSTGAEA